MAKLQFTSTDTVKWAEKFGNYSDGDETPSGTFSNQKTSFTGTEGANTGTVGSETGFAIGDIVFIYQSRNGGDGAGVWQLNKITNISGTTFTFKYALTQDFATTGQIIKIKKNRNVNMASGTLTAPAWDGTTGGVIVMMGRHLYGTAATITAAGKGYRGGNGVAAGVGVQGEGTTGTGGQSRSPNTNGGGGGENGGGNGAGGGAGGGHSHDGSNGQTGSGGALGGLAGSTLGNAELTLLLFGGGGGGGSRGNGVTGNPGTGAPGGGIVVLIFETIDLTGITVSVNGQTAPNDATQEGSGGGAGAAGSALLKGQVLILGTNKITAALGTGGAKGGGGNGGNGGDSATGRIRAEYSKSISGSATPTISEAQDKVFNVTRGAASLVGFL